MPLLPAFLRPSSQTAGVDLWRRFERLGPVGKGTMSEVFAARDRATGRKVAVKLLDADKTDAFEARFEGLNKPPEGEIAVRIDHPRCARTLEHGVAADGRRFLVIDWLPGTVLADLLKTDAAFVRRHRRRILLDAAEAVAHLHAEGWIHRDVCPRNLLVRTENGPPGPDGGGESRGHAVLIDFGLVVPDTAPFRRPGNRTGTAAYMAPELLKRRSTDNRLDQFGLGATCYRVLAGRMPWAGSDDGRPAGAAAAGRMNAAPVPLKEAAPKLPGALCDAVDRSLAVEPSDRWESVADFREALAESLPPDPRR